MPQRTVVLLPLTVLILTAVSALSAGTTQAPAAHRAGAVSSDTRDEPKHTAVLTPDGQTLVKLLAYWTPSQVD